MVYFQAAIQGADDIQMGEVRRMVIKSGQCSYMTLNKAALPTADEKEY
jgi:hypothetical protein